MDISTPPDYWAWKSGKGKHTPGAVWFKSKHLDPQSNYLSDSFLKDEFHFIIYIF